MHTFTSVMPSGVFCLSDLAGSMLSVWVGGWIRGLSTLQGAAMS